jgi:hypothetical protein
MMLAYGDAAFYDKMGFYGVAVLVAPSNEWARLETRWLKALHEFDSALDVFHMTDFQAGARPFRGRARPDREKLLKKLVRVLCEHVTYAQACVLLPDAQRALVELNKRQGVPTLGENFYALCADGCIGLISHWLDGVSPTKQVGYAFEAGDKGLGHFRHTVEWIHSRSSLYADEMKIASIKEIPKKEDAAAQTPDILAYAATHYRLDQILEHERPAYLEQLASFIPVKVAYLDENTIRKGSAGFTSEVALALARNHNLLPRQRGSEPPTVR